MRNKNSMSSKSKSNLGQKKIIFVTNTLAEGGAAKILVFVANHFADCCREVVVISLYDKDISTAFGNQIVSIPLGCEISSSTFKRLLHRITLARLLRKEVKASNPDLVCSFVSDVVVLTKIALVFTDLPIVGAERGDPYTLNTAWKLLTSLTYARCSSMVFQLERAMNFYGNRVRTKSVIIPNPYFPVPECSEPIGDKREGILVAGAGRFVKEKGFDLLIKAFRTVLDVYPNSKLIIFGDGPLRNQYEKLISELGLHDKVHLPGYVNNLQAALRGTSVFVLSSRSEGIPNVLIEAMTMGIPTVSTNCSPGGPAFLTQEGKRGILVPAEDAEGLASGIVAILTDAELAKQLSRDGLQLKEELNPESIKNQWLSVAERILA